MMSVAHLITDKSTYYGALGRTLHQERRSICITERHTGACESVCRRSREQSKSKEKSQRTRAEKFRRIFKSDDRVARTVGKSTHVLPAFDVKIALDPPRSVP